MTRRFLSPLVLIALLVIVAAPGCRSKVKPQAAPAPVATTEAPRVVDTGARDFVPAQAEDPHLSADVLELNRIARDRGWIMDAFFAFDSNTLDDRARRSLDASAKWLADNPSLKLTIEGHADERGTQQYNLALGARRSHTAAEYLSVLGVDPERIQTVSYGKERPFAEGSDESAWSQNRRAHLVLRR